MNAAKDGLLKYVETPKTLDRDQHRRLVAELKRAEAEFMRATSLLNE